MINLSCFLIYFFLNIMETQFLVSLPLLFPIKSSYMKKLSVYIPEILLKSTFLRIKWAYTKKSPLTIPFLQKSGMLRCIFFIYALAYFKAQDFFHKIVLYTDNYSLFALACFITLDFFHEIVLCTDNFSLFALAALILRLSASKLHYTRTIFSTHLFSCAVSCFSSHDFNSMSKF